ncbi:SusC/RagA family TonB-linked outer membrane protein [[Flexibacter] sp. ATCC 35208]|uniref:SusC/RagA family TonB-linked outer membrane protein n=1 Tax=[Flexibacter] sp. ATCC 35208 TaxID=1936242 RepID=UPI0009F88544|nr:SusC/RagA family TonB-linked outer membrane protein [[Flexibacter] sp. ATCC 35208]
MKGRSYLMKVCIVVIFLLISLLPGRKAIAQISISLHNKPVTEIMDAIATRQHISFHYDKATVDVDKPVSFNCNNLTLTQALDQLSALTGFQFTLRGENVIVSAVPENIQLHNPLALQKEISGRVLSLHGSPLPGVTVIIKNTTRGVKTDDAGYYAINTGLSDVLIFRSVGYINREIMVPVATTTLDITLTENIKGLNELIVTALGIPKNNKELPYSTGLLNSDDISTVKDANVINNLSGRIAGVMVNRSASGIGGSARVVLRGNKSTRENQPLYIIDGVPMANFTPSQPTDIWGESSGITGNGGRDGGDGISNLNPDDIESISVLKSASAAALYGSQAANGVIMITTKKGHSGKGHIEVSSDLTAEIPLLLPALQYRYAQTTPPYTDEKQAGSADSWGAPIHAKDHVKPFFNTGRTSMNGLSISGGIEKTQYYISYSNTMNRGIMPINRLQKHSFNMRVTSDLLKNKLHIDANISYLVQYAVNRPSSGLYFNPLTGLYTFPRGLDFNSYKEYQYFDNSRNMYMQNWWNINNSLGWTGQDDQQNPYWIQKRDEREDNRHRGLASLSARYRFNDWLSLQGRTNFDKSDDQYEMKAYAGTQQVLSPPNGRYTLEKESNKQFYADMMLTAARQVSPSWKLQGMLGASITDIRAHDRSLISTNATAAEGLIVANKFSVKNIASNALDAQQSVERKQLQALFGSAQVHFKNSIFLDLTGRNDWSSTFAFTPIKDKGYFYYSSGISTIISELVKLPAIISFAKVRLSYAKAGNDIAPYSSRPARFILQTTAGVSRVNFNTRTPYPGIYLKPEDNRSLEAGTEIRLLKDRISLDFTWYKNNNYQQYMEVRAPSGSGYLYYYLNLGNIQNKGVEATLTIVPVQHSNIRWSTTINCTVNCNRVKQLSSNTIPGAGPDNYYILTDFNTNMYGSFIKEGGSWGDIYTNKELYKNEKGQYVIDDQGNLVTRNVFKKVGNPNPRLITGWSNTLEYRHFTLSCLIDGRFGGEVMSVTSSVLDNYGVSERSAKARDNGGVALNAVYENGVPLTVPYDARKFFSTIGGRAGIGEMYMYDATNIRLRELSLTYEVPVKNKYINRLQIGLLGKNLCFFKLKAPFDPEVAMSSGNGLQGIDVFGVSATRSIGIHVKAAF